MKSILITLQWRTLSSAYLEFSQSLLFRNTNLFSWNITKVLYLPKTLWLIATLSKDSREVIHYLIAVNSRSMQEWVTDCKARTRSEHLVFWRNKFKGSDVLETRGASSWSATMHSAKPTLLLAEVLLCHGAGHQQLPHCRLDGHTELVLFGADVKGKKSTGE